MKESRFLPYQFLWFSLFPVLALYAFNSAEVPLLSAFKACAVSAVFFTLVFVGLKKLRFSGQVSGILTSLAALGFFSYGHFFSFFRDLVTTHWIERVDDRSKFIYHFTVGMHLVFTLAGFGVFLTIAKRSLKWGKGAEAFLRVMNLMGIVLILIASLNIGRAMASSGLRTSFGNHGGSLETPSGEPGDDRPDIYYIILDGFTRLDMMKQVYHVDLDVFRASLKDAGFYVAETSHSNYSQTLLSLASSLNMRYLDLDVAGWKKEQKGKKKFFDMIAQSRVVSFLKAHGYRYVHLGSVVSVTASNPQADVLISYDKSIFGDEFYRSLFQTTWLRVFDFLISNNIAEMHLYNFDQISKVPDTIDSPKFVFAHFVMPHSPYVFDKNGNTRLHVRQVDIWDPNQNKWNDANAYREQVIFAAKKSMEMVRQILQKSKRPPIIILQGDHGTNLIYNGAQYEREARNLRHSELNVYFFPDRNYTGLWPSISPVNSFRVIFNKYFGAAFEMLPDYSTYTGQG